MGLNLGSILKVALPIFGGPWGAAAGGLLAASDAARQSSQGRGQQQAAANYYLQLQQQAQQAQAELQALLPHLASQAGYDYFPGIAAGGAQAAASPSCTPLAPTAYQNDPYYQNAYNAYTTPLEHERAAQVAQLLAQQQVGLHQKGYAENLVNQHVNEAEAQFNRDYMDADRQRRLAAQQQLIGGITGQQALGSIGAAGLTGIGAGNLQMGANAMAPITAALGQILTPVPKAPATQPTGAATGAQAGGAIGGAVPLPDTQTPASSGVGTNYDPGNIDPGGFQAQSVMRRNGLPDIPAAPAGGIAPSGGYSAPPQASLSSLHALIHGYTSPGMNAHFNAIQAAIRGMYQ